MKIRDPYTGNLVGSSTGGVFTSADSRVKELDAKVERLRRMLEGAEIGMQIRDRALEQAEARLARVVEAGNHLASEVSELPWRPGEGHLTDAVEMWRSVTAALAAAKKGK